MTDTKDPSTLQHLLTRIEAATGPDKDLDALLYWELEHRRAIATTSSPYQSAPAFTASIDAALALVERVLGAHWLWQIKKGIEFQCILWMLETDYDGRAVPTGYSAASAPLAILAALLRALLARSEVTP